MKKLKLYIDTSVIGGCLNKEFAADSNALIDLARAGKATLLLSDLLAAELLPAPTAVQNIIATLPPAYVLPIHTTPEVERLRDAYLRAKAAGPRQRSDAQHIALASVAQADILVSWNFKHIVHYNKIRMFNAVNLNEGYPPLEIRSPREVV